MRIPYNSLCLIVVAMGLIHFKQVNAQTIAAGDDHTLRVCSDGTVYAWGKNQNGQLGIGTNTDSNMPVQVPILTDVVAVAAGENHSMALRSDGTVWTWGDNIEGQLGNGTNEDSNTPAQVAGLFGVIAIAAGDYHSLALKNDDTVWAWGWNNYGQLGDGTEDDSAVPVLCGPLSAIGVTAMAAGGQHSVFLRNNGQILACGRNNLGQLGDGTNNHSAFPVQVGFSATNFIGVAAAAFHTLFLQADGTVYTCGDNSGGQLGNNSTENSNFPVQITTLTNAIGITAGQSQSFALTQAGQVFSWGWNMSGELGLGNNTQSNVPVQIDALSSIEQIAAGQGHCLAIRSDGAVFSWGVNEGGQLGNGSNDNSNVPVLAANSCAAVSTVSATDEAAMLSVYPNPSRGVFSLQAMGNLGVVRVELYNLQGLRLDAPVTHLRNGLCSIDLTAYPKGVYALNVSNAGGIYTHKLFVQ